VRGSRSVFAVCPGGQAGYLSLSDQCRLMRTVLGLAPGGADPPISPSRSSVAGIHNDGAGRMALVRRVRFALFASIA